MSDPGERERAVDLYLTALMTTAQVVEHLGYPTRQCLERRLAKDHRYAGHMAEPIIPLETRTKAIEPVPGGTCGGSRPPDGSARASAPFHNRVKAHREGGMAALQTRNRNAGQSDKPAVRRNRDAGDAEALRRRVEEPEPGERVDAGGGGGRGKTPAPACGACRTGRRPC